MYLSNDRGGICMDCWVQTNEDMNPVRVENLSETEAQGIVKLLKTLASEGELVFIRDCRTEEDIYDNSDQWYSRQDVNSSRRIQATDDMAERIGYAVDYRNMHTAIHGLIWSPDERLIHKISALCEEIENTDNDDLYDAYVGEIEGYLASNEVFVEEEINYRDITDDYKYYFDDDQYVEVINILPYDLYM